MLLNPDWVEACAALVDEDRGTMRALALSIATKHGTTLAEMRSMCHAKNIIAARYEFAYRAVRELGKSKPQASAFLNRCKWWGAYAYRTFKGAQ